MQPVPALRLERIAAQFLVAGDAPNVGGNVIFFAEDLLGAQGFVAEWGRCRTSSRCTLGFLIGRLEAVDALEDAFVVTSLGHGGHGVVFVDRVR